MRNTFIVISVFFIVIACSKPERIEDRIRNDKRSYWKNFCLTEENILIVDGKRYENVRGENEFYIKLKRMNTILFVVDEKDHSISYHIYKLDKREDVVIKGSSSMFGRTIGSPDTKDSVEEIGNGKLILWTHIEDEKGKYKCCDYLDINKSEVVGTKTYFYDKAGKLIREHGDPLPVDFSGKENGK